MILIQLFIWLTPTLGYNQHEIPGVFMKLEGTWQRTEYPEIFEEWTIEDQIMRGEGYRLTASKKQTLEKLTIEKKGEHWYFIPDVPHNPAPVNFRITEISENAFYSENPEHDFPTWIKYEFMNDSTIAAQIGDQKETVHFGFKKFKD